HRPLSVTSQLWPDLVDRDLVRLVVRRAIGAEIGELSLTRQTRCRETFRTLVAGREVFIKTEVPIEAIDRRLCMEAWALAQARDAGLPTPEVLHLDCSELEVPFRY